MADSEPKKGNEARDFNVPQTAWLRYGLAVAAVVLAVLLTSALHRFVGPEGVRIVFALFYLAVFFSAWLGGQGPGLFSALTSAVVASYLFFPPYNLLKLRADGLLQVAIFVATSLMIVLIMERGRRARAAVRLSRESLRQSEERMAIAQEAGNIGTFDWDVRTNTVEWSEKLESIFGLPPGGFGGTFENWRERVQPEDLARCEASIGEAFARGDEDWEAEYRMFRADTGEMRWIYARSRIFYDERRAPLRMVGTNIDITERRRTELELRASEASYRALADAMPQIVWTARSDGFLDYYNRRWFEYTGRDFEQTRGWGWQGLVHPDDAERSLRAWATAVERGSDYTVQFRLRRADGQYRWHLGRAEPMRDGAGRVTRWFGTATDIHDQKQAEERLGFLAEAGEILTVSLEYESTLERFARLAVEALADYCLIDVVGEGGSIERLAIAHRDPERESLVAELRRYPPDPAKAEGVAKVVRSGETDVVLRVTDEHLRAIARDREHHELLRRLSPSSFLIVPLAARGRIIGALTCGLTDAGRAYTRDDVAFAEELARRAALAFDNARLYRDAQEANRAKDEFLAMLSHELRTPLTPIIGWSHMIRSGRLGEADAEQGMQVIEKNSQALSRLINDLLDMSSILSGKMRIEREPVDLSSVIGEAVETIRPQAEARRVSVSFAAPQTPLTVSGDRTRLVQVFWNLLHNAVKFSRAGGRVGVECRATGEDVRVVVSDDGQGIPEDFLQHVFERFRQADGSTTRAHGGLGIGLALVKSFVEAHAGSVRAESDGAGRGSRFIVTLPLAERARARDETEIHAGAEPPCGENGCRVLVVEDASDTLDLLCVVFDEHGYRTMACSNAEEALRVAESESFDLVVSDIGLPNVDGYELIRRLRRLPEFRSVPAIALTGYAAAKDADEALAAGFDAHVPKPVDPLALLAEIERLMSSGVRDGEAGS